MREEEFEIAIKVIIVGNGAVGKSSMIQRYCKGIFTKDYKKTIGVDFLERELETGGEAVRLMLWDTAGQEEFDAITRAYYRGAQACVLTYSSTDRASFDAIHLWKKKVENEVGAIAMVLVHNKIDLRDSCVVTEEEAEALASDLRIQLYCTSVKENVNVDFVFECLAEKCLNDLSMHLADDSKPQSIGMSVPVLMDRANTQSAASKEETKERRSTEKRNGHSSSSREATSAIILHPGVETKASRKTPKKSHQKCSIVG